MDRSGSKAVVRSPQFCLPSAPFAELRNANAVLSALHHELGTARSDLAIHRECATPAIGDHSLVAVYYRAGGPFDDAPLLCRIKVAPRPPVQG